MAQKVNNKVFEIEITPKRKRKREPEINVFEGQSNAGFCSTPKKGAQLFVESKNNISSYRKLNKEPFVNPCLEVKSIAEIANAKSLEIDNAFEVIRNPPKKKKKSDLEDKCFVNPALNLDLPDKQFNPFEVQRSVKVEENQNCFTNQGLNIRNADIALAVNPFEITRQKIIESCKDGIVNPALELPAGLTIALPFQPTVGCRINFAGFGLENITPTKLLAEKLILSPEDASYSKKTPGKNFCRSLSVISEESVLDIGEKLDCYQLELENSINEAKIRKSTQIKPIQQVVHYIPEDSYLYDCWQEEKGTNTSPSLSVPFISVTRQNEPQKEDETKLHEQEKIELTIKDTLDEAELNETDDEVDFKEPAPFIRAYRKPPAQKPKEIETIPIPQDIKLQEQLEKHKFSSTIRKSFRKLVRQSKVQKQPVNSEGNNQKENNIFSSIRHSFRMRAKGRNSVPDKDNKHQEFQKVDINTSILEPSERKIFRAISENENCGETMKNILEKNTIRSSLRKSTKGMRNQILKSVFQKNMDKYNMNETGSVQTDV